jgi:hypothetical protein
MLELKNISICKEDLYDLIQYGCEEVGETNPTEVCPNCKDNPTKRNYCLCCNREEDNDLDE